MEKVNVLLLGAHINNTNLGCQALTYSMISLLEKVAIDNDIEFDYYVVENRPDQNITKEFISNIQIRERTICLSTYRFPFMVTLKDKVRNLFYFQQFKRLIKKSNIAIDLTAGDSFADIYGSYRFLATTRVKELVEKLGIPLILGPQTYGPFNDKNNEVYASRIIGDAYRIITRDYSSAQYVQRITGREIQVTTDLAFRLPYNKIEMKSSKKMIGLNISGLLVSDSPENTFSKKSLKTDYDTYIRRLLDFLIGSEEYEIFLIPHVKADVNAINIYHDKYPSTNLVEEFKNPMAAKSFISNMDIFIGARMHATIGAFTSGVVTIPTAYSRKFETMFSVVDYDVVVDLQELDTDEAYEQTKIYILDFENLKEHTKMSLKKAALYQKETEAFFSDAIMNLLS